MPRCRTCNQDWPDTLMACPHDGSPLSAEIHAAYPHASAEWSLAADLLPGVAVGEYRIDKKIGEGGMGAVYAATHPLIGKRAAVKVISAALCGDPSAVSRFVQEARSVNQIGHPNIVDVFAFGQLADGRSYFVMEYLHGESLAERIARSAMSLGEAIQILDQVADALEAAHEKQIVHRDLKPDNVYLASVRGGRTLVKLLDFGIAKLSAGDGSGGVQKTRTGFMMGTAGYISPEQARGKDVDHRTDIYALGCMTFEIACGRLPFVADSAMDIVLMHMSMPPPRASQVWPEIPVPLDHLIARMLDKNAAARPSLTEVRAVFSELVTAGLVTLDKGRTGAFGSTLGHAASERMASTPPPGTLALGTQPSTAGVTIAPARRRRGAAIAAFVATLALGAAGIFLATQGGTATEPQAAAQPMAPSAPPPAEVVRETPAPPPPPQPVSPPPADATVPHAPGRIEIEVNVAGAAVTIDGEPVTVVGKRATAVLERDGAHVVAISAAGRVPYENTVEITAGRTIVITARLERVRGARSKRKASSQGSGAGTAAPQDPNNLMDPF